MWSSIQTEAAPRQGSLLAIDKTTQYYYRPLIIDTIITDEIVTMISTFLLIFSFSFPGL